MNTCFVKIESVKVILYLGAWINFYPYFPHLLSHLGKIWYKRSAHDDVQHFWVLWKSAEGRQYCLYRRTRNSIYVCTVKTHDILKEKNATQSCYKATSNWFSTTVEFYVVQFVVDCSEMFTAISHCGRISFEVPATKGNVKLHILLLVSYLLDQPKLRIPNWLIRTVCKCS